MGKALLINESALVYSFVGPPLFHGAQRARGRAERYSSPAGEHGSASTRGRVHQQRNLRRYQRRETAARP